jgi:hypothetical protein
MPNGRRRLIGLSVLLLPAASRASAAHALPPAAVSAQENPSFNLGNDRTGGALIDARAAHSEQFR